MLDKEGFLRSRDALIQTIGHQEIPKGKATFAFADRRTEAMEQAIAETTRRRLAQGNV